MAILLIKTASGERKTITAETGTPMMDALRDAGLVDGTCGGIASCGTCHIYFANAAIVGNRSEDEIYMLEGLEDFVEVRETSRLSCQITVSSAHDGAEIEIAPEA